MSRTPHRWLGIAAALFALWLTTTQPRVAQAQASWEYTPYEVRLRVAMVPAPQLTDELLATLAASIRTRSEAVLGAVWHIEVAAAPQKLQSELLGKMEQ